MDTVRREQARAEHAFEKEQIRHGKLYENIINLLEECVDMVKAPEYTSCHEYLSLNRYKQPSTLPSIHKMKFRSSNLLVSTSVYENCGVPLEKKQAMTRLTAGGPGPGGGDVRVLPISPQPNAPVQTQRLSSKNYEKLFAARFPEMEPHEKNDTPAVVKTTKMVTRDKESTTTPSLMAPALALHTSTPLIQEPISLPPSVPIKLNVETQADFKESPGCKEKRETDGLPRTKRSRITVPSPYRSFQIDEDYTSKDDYTPKEEKTPTSRPQRKERAKEATEVLRPQLYEKATQSDEQPPDETKNELSELKAKYDDQSVYVKKLEEEIDRLREKVIFPAPMAQQRCPQLERQNSSICEFCKDKELPLCENNLHHHMFSFIGLRHFNEVVLTVLLRSDNIYHINVRELKTGNVLGCVLATDAAIEEAIQLNMFEYFPTFCVTDVRNTLKPRDCPFGMNFELVHEKREDAGQVSSSPKDVITLYEKKIANQINTPPTSNLRAMFSVTKTHAVPIPPYRSRRRPAALKISVINSKYVLRDDDDKYPVRSIEVSSITDLVGSGTKFKNNKHNKRRKTKLRSPVE
ncbi:uncharacterized protein LOC115630634 [Scaptodrosophila lebanonensis]|uniref:Uncharacterized protein LOC115630634 n=1 Tax=Drosophila lebanonensis TaxID=7225 RepID=A0A6J2U5A6_DROLE|nr:uncharacterized protein LOC115630634 [Scaptodrosophila lebanonensis]